MNDAGMICVLFPQLFQDRSCLKLLRQGRVIGRGITDCQNRESVEGLRFEIIGVLVAELAHRFFVGDHPIARSNWSMTRLSNCVRGITIGRNVIDIYRSNESTL